MDIFIYRLFIVNILKYKYILKIAIIPILRY